VKGRWWTLIRKWEGPVHLLCVKDKWREKKKPCSVFKIKGRFRGGGAKETFSSEGNCVKREMRLPCEKKSEKGGHAGK